MIGMNSEIPDLRGAGIWDRWVSPDGEMLDSTAIVTTSANDLVRQVHERMPVILSRDNYDAWLDPTLQDPARLSSLTVPWPAEEMALHPVRPRVNSPKWDDPGCVERVGA